MLAMTAGFIFKATFIVTPKVCWLKIKIKITTNLCDVYFRLNSQVGTLRWS